MKKYSIVILIISIALCLYLHDRDAIIKPLRDGTENGTVLEDYDYTSDLYASLKSGAESDDALINEQPNEDIEYDEDGNPIQSDKDNVTVKGTNTGLSGTSELSSKYYAQKVKNSETVGWLVVPDTAINYPVMSSTDNSYYLEHDPNKNLSKNGSVFMDSALEGSYGKIVLLHGHNMKNGKIFGSLSKYANKSIFEKSNVIRLFDGSEERKYVPFSVFYIDANKESIPLSFKNPNGYTEYIKTLKDRSMFPSTYNGVDTDLLIMQTCAYIYERNSGKDGRLVVACYRIK